MKTASSENESKHVFDKIVLVPDNKVIPPNWEIFSNDKNENIIGYIMYSANAKKYFFIPSLKCPILGEEETKEIFSFLKKTNHKHRRNK